MIEKFEAFNDETVQGNPAGGIVTGVGLEIRWQNGPLGRGVVRKEPNGAFVETVLAAAKQRLEFYQAVSDGKFKCPENNVAIGFLNGALEALSLRTKDRVAREVEGTHNA